MVNIFSVLGSLFLRIGLVFGIYSMNLVAIIFGVLGLVSTAIALFSQSQSFSKLQECIKEEILAKLLFPVIRSRWLL